jgi:hypothetical protein
MEVSNSIRKTRRLRRHLTPSWAFLSFRSFGSSAAHIFRSKLAGIFIQFDKLELAIHDSQVWLAPTLG